MVKYWQSKDSVRAKVLQHKEGHYYMVLEGEDYPFPGFPRGVVLMKSDKGYSNFSIMKHIIKNFVFNDTWKLLQEGRDQKAIRRIKTEMFDKLKELYDVSRLEMLPYKNLQPPVKKIYDAFTKTSSDPRVCLLRDIMCFILEEDDAYRFRVQWLAKYMPDIEKGLSLMEHAEVSEDMRGRIRLLKTVLLLILKDPKIKDLYDKFNKNINWRKVRLTKADKYYLRAKYFKCDYPAYEY